MASVEQRLLLLSALLCALATGLAFFMSAYKVEQSARNARADRIKLILAQIEKVAESNISMGITPEEMRTLASMLQRQKSSDVSILSVDVFLPGGKIVQSSDSTRVGQMVPKVSHCSAYVGNPVRVQVFDRSMRLVGGFFNGFDGIEACANIDVDTTELELSAKRSQNVLLVACLLASLFGTAVLFFALRSVFRSFLRQADAAVELPSGLDHPDTLKWRALLQPWLKPST